MIKLPLLNNHIHHDVKSLAESGPPWVTPRIAWRVRHSYPSCGASNLVPEVVDYRHIYMFSPVLVPFQELQEALSAHGLKDYMLLLHYVSQGTYKYYNNSVSIVSLQWQWCHTKHILQACYVCMCATCWVSSASIMTLPTPYLTGSHASCCGGQLPQGKVPTHLNNFAEQLKEADAAINPTSFGNY